MDYKSNIEKALKFIEDHLTKSFIMENIAKEAGYSVFHFIRIFSSTVGISPGKYIRMRRLTEASKDLALGNRDIGELASKYQFLSHESFTREFKRYIGIPPSRYRENQQISNLLNPFEVIDKKIITESKWLIGEPEEIILPEFKIAGVTHNYSIYDDDVEKKIIKMWKENIKKLNSLNNDEKTYAFCFPDKNDSNRLEYMAAVKVNSFNNKKDFICKTIQKNKYLKFIHTGKYKQLTDSFLYIYGSWLPGSKYNLADPYDFDCYKGRINSKNIFSNNSKIELYIPVK